MSGLTVFTIADAAFLPGLAALVNSLRSAAFDGPIVVGTVGPLGLGEIEDVRQVALPSDAWPGLLKPDLLLAEAGGPFVFLDADVVAGTADALSRLPSLAATALTVAVEGLVAPTDHRRRRWALRLDAPPPRPDAWTYVNSGFLAGDMRRDRPVLEAWRDGQRHVLSRNVKHYDDDDFPFPDQDMLNAVLQSSREPVVSVQFPDWWSGVAPLNPFLHVGGFAGPAFYHSIGEKPWRLRRVPPRGPNAYEALWFRHAVLDPHPVRVPVTLPASVQRWLRGSLAGHLESRGRRLAQRVKAR